MKRVKDFWLGVVTATIGALGVYGATQYIHKETHAEVIEAHEPEIQEDRIIIPDETTLEETVDKCNTQMSIVATERLTEIAHKMEPITNALLYATTNLGFSPSKHYTYYVDDSQNADKLHELTVIAPNVIPNEVPIKSLDTKEHRDSGMEYRLPVTDSVRLTSQEDDLLDEKEFYKSEGYTISYSATTNFNDPGDECHGSPVTDAFLARSWYHQISTAFHEGYHATNDNSPSRELPRIIEESIADAVGDMLTLEYAAHIHGMGSGQYADAFTSYEESKEFHAGVVKLYAGVNEAKKIENVDQRNTAVTAAFDTFHSEQGRSGWNLGTLMHIYPYAKHYEEVIDLYESTSDPQYTLRIVLNCPNEEEACSQHIQKFTKAKHTEGLPYSPFSTSPSHQQ